jgi:hypothetical protein
MNGLGGLNKSPEGVVREARIHWDVENNIYQL